MYLASIILQSLVLGTQILLVAVSLYLVFAASRIISLAVGAIGTVSVYALYWGIIEGWPVLGAILFAIGLTIVLGLFSSEITMYSGIHGLH